MKIAYGNSRTDKHWKNSDISWDDFCTRVSQTQRTTETVEEFRKLKKGQQDAIKDVGGFVGGHLAKGNRKKGSVLCRSMLTLDMDYATSTVWDEITMFFDFACCIYSTHKHTPEKPRLRLIIPLSRDVTEEEYPAVARMVAKELGMDLFDDTTYQANRMMYWASTSINGEYIFECQNGSFLDPDVYLAKYDDWHDVSTYPVSSRQSEVIAHTVREQQDPLTKDGVVGAFCRTYTIQEAIAKFLTKVYAPSAMEGRYDYIPADSSAGVQVFDDKFAYSHHATDPASEHLLNAFDLVRIHLFPDEDDKKSFKEMAEFASKDENVKMLMIQEKQKQALLDFADEDWQKQLDLDRSGNIRASLDNIVLILRHDENLQNIAFNLHRDGIDVRGSLPWKQAKSGWNDSDSAALKVYLSKTYGVYSPTKTKDAVVAVAAERAYHPIKAYLDSLPEWDGVPRVETLFIDYFGAEDSRYTRAVSKKSMIAAVARIYRPGVKFDCVPILNGPQGIGKSTFFAKLAGEWFSDSLTLTDMKDKAGPEKLQGYWILELGELAGMRKADVETVKSFISRVDDKYRASYGVNVESHPRQCIIVGSTNAESGFLRDITGNRRFLPIRVNGGSAKKPWQMTEEDVRQIWAETLVLYRKGEKLYLEGEEAVLAVEEQSQAMEADEREGLVRTYLETLLPDNWDSLSLYERKSYLSGGDFGGKPDGKNKREYVCNMEIWCECFGKEAAAMKPTDSYAIAAIMKKISGWSKCARRRYAFYGLQRGYQKE